MTQRYIGYEKYAGQIQKSEKGSIIHTGGTGQTTTYALRKLEDKGHLYIESNKPCYEGMIVGEHKLERDIEMNAIKAK